MLGLKLNPVSKRGHWCGRGIMHLLQFGYLGNDCRELYIAFGLKVTQYNMIIINTNSSIHQST